MHFSISLLKLKTFQVDSGQLVQHPIQSSHYLDQVWEKLFFWAHHQTSETKHEILSIFSSKL